VFSKLNKFVKLPFSEKLSFAEAVLLLFSAKIMVYLIPFRKIAPYLGNVNGVYRTELTEHERTQANKVKLFIYMAAGNVSVKSVCLDQALACMVMLRRKKIPCSVYFGVKKNESEKKLAAHAWVVCGNEILVGGMRSNQYTPVAYFSANY
jgi:hypothetical protein